MAPITKRIADLETKTSRGASTALTIIRKILNPKAVGCAWAATFDPKYSPKLADAEVRSEPGEHEEQFRARVQDIADKHRKRGEPVRIFLTSLDAEL